MSTARSFRPDSGPSEPSRVVKVDARLYYDIAATSPELVRRMDELARERIGGLQKLAAEPRTRSSHPAWKPLGQRLPRSSPFSRTQPDFLQLADAGRSESRRPLAGTAAARERLPGAAASPTGRSSSGRSRESSRRGSAFRPLRAFRNTIRSSLAGDRRASPPLSTGPQRAYARSWSSRRRREARRRRRRESRTIWAFRAASRARSSRAGRFGRPNAWALKFSSRARLSASILTPAASCSTTRRSCNARTVIVASGVSWRRLDRGRLRPAARQGDILRRGAQRSEHRSRARRASHRRRKLGRPGGDVFRQPCANRDPDRARRRARKKHVALSDRPDPHANRTFARRCARRSRRFMATPT